MDQCIDNQHIYIMLGLIIVMPFLGSIIQAFYGKSLQVVFGETYGRWLSGSLAFGFVGTSFLLACNMFANYYMFSKTDPLSVRLTYFHWINLEQLSIPFEFLLDPLSIVMTLLITGVGSFIHLFSTGYMSKDKDYSRFFTYLNLFIGFMLILVLSNNLLVMFVGWEGVGLCSYLLIGFWYQDLNNCRAANKAFIVNRVGDFGLLMGILWIGYLLFQQYGAKEIPGFGLVEALDPRWFSYDIIFGLIGEVVHKYPEIITPIALLLFIGAVGKSAQFPLYIWLPDAMAGPTPVSALIHAATMVTAGIFLMNRMHIIYELSPVASSVVALTGAFTAIWAALIALKQTDIKKVLAFSTVSQLGYMFIACGVGAYWVGIFHVLTHAFFKALLFLGAGSVIYAMSHEQDMRKYGNLWKYLPVTSSTMIIASLAISGFPLLSGFWSKEAILHSAFSSTFPSHILGLETSQWVGWTGLIVAVLTAIYMTRMTVLTFGIPFTNGEERWKTANYDSDHHDVEPYDREESVHISKSEEKYYYSSNIFSAASVDDHQHHLNKNHIPQESPLSMTLPLIVLAFLSLFGGYILHQNHTLESLLSQSSGPVYISKELLHNHHATLDVLLYLSLAASFIGISGGVYKYYKGMPKKETKQDHLWPSLDLWMKHQFYFDDAMQTVFGKMLSRISFGFYKIFDQFFINGILRLIVSMTGYVGDGMQIFQNGYLSSYIFLMVLGFSIMVFFMSIMLIFGGNL